jgi:hypothetical protein
MGPLVTKEGVKLTANAAFCRFGYQLRPLVKRAC